MKEKWTTDMKHKLEGHKMVPPAGLWEGISSEMGFQPMSTSQAVAVKRWYWAVAAIVLALVGFFAVYQFDQNESFPQADHTTQAIQTSDTSIIKEVNPKNRELMLADVPKHKTKNTKGLSLGIVSVESTAEVVEETTPQASEEKLQKVSEDEAPKQTSRMASHPVHSEASHQATVNDQSKQMPASKSTREWSIGLNVSGGLIASVHHNALDMPDNYADLKPEPESTSSDNPELTMPPSSNIPRRSMQERPNSQKHHLPIHLGLNLHYQLNNRMALLSGISYTYLHSEFIFYSNNRKYDQELHYLGIPIGLFWQLWRTNGFSLYLSGTTTLAKCLNKKPWQWSVKAAVGAEYAISPQLGLYLEPSLGYYFNDGTTFEHYYKEHPLAPSVEFGFRLHINNNSITRTGLK